MLNLPASITNGGEEFWKSKNSQLPKSRDLDLVLGRMTYHRASTHIPNFIFIWVRQTFCGQMWCTDAHWDQLY